MHAASSFVDERHRRPSAPRPHGRILIVDDEPEELRMNEIALKAHGYMTRSTHSPSEGRRIAAEWRPDLIVLDVSMPECDGFTLCERIRHDYSDALFIFVSKSAEVESKLLGLQLADDYITKPYEAQEFVARVGVVLRRRERELEAQASMRSAAVTIDPVNQTARLANGHTVRLTRCEFRLLAQLMEARGAVVSFEDLMRDENDRSGVQVYVHRLRRKIEADPSKPQLIMLAPKQGYYYAGAI